MYLHIAPRLCTWHLPIAMACNSRSRSRARAAHATFSLAPFSSWSHRTAAVPSWQAILFRAQFWSCVLLVSIRRAPSRLVSSKFTQYVVQRHVRLPRSTDPQQTPPDALMHSCTRKTAPSPCPALTQHLVPVGNHYKLALDPAKTNRVACIFRRRPLILGPDLNTRHFL
jgi:hypothetical protein